MKKTEKPFILLSKSGYTFIELIIALVILSILGVGMWQGLVRVSRLLDRIYVVHSGISSTVVMDERIREEVSRIIIPFWIPGVPVTEDKDGVAIDFYNGEKGKALCFRFTDNYLIMGDDNGKVLCSFGPFSDVRIETHRNPQGVATGIRFIIYGDGMEKRPLTIVAGFRSCPFTGRGI